MLKAGALSSLDCSDQRLYQESAHLFQNHRQLGFKCSSEIEPQSSAICFVDSEKRAAEHPSSTDRSDLSTDRCNRHDSVEG